MEPEQMTNELGADPRNGKRSYRRKQSVFSLPNIIGIVLCILLLPGFLIGATLLFRAVIQPDRPPSCLGFTPLIAQTGSMSPLFEANDLVLIKNGADNASYDVGTVICYRSGDDYITHRIVSVDEENGETLYTTQGDANNTPDQPRVRADQILGVYRAHSTPLGRAILFIQTPLGMIVCVMLPILLVILLFSLPSVLAARRERRLAAGQERIAAQENSAEEVSTKETVPTGEDADKPE